MNMGYLAGTVATKQLNEGRHFICENPAGSALYQLEPWLILGEDPRIHRTIMHQCAAGLVDPENRQPIKKPTEFWASDFCLIQQLSGMQCSCRVPHSTLEGRYKGMAKTHMARVWPWRLAAAIANGVSALIRRQYRNSCKTSGPGSGRYQQYASLDTTMDCPPYSQKQRKVPTDWECPGCRQSKPAGSNMHTRIEYE